jgi:hydrogenase/urease accessory protein HupE
MKRSDVLTAFITLLLVAPGAAQAHLVNSGLGPFYDGTLHLLLSPLDLLGLVAAALLAGLRGAGAARLMVIVLPVSWLLAGMLGMKLPLTLDLDWLSVLSLMVLGVLLAADARLPPVAVASIGVIYGAIHGLLNGSALAVMGAGPSSLFGIVLAVVLLALLTAAGVIPLRALWARVAVRVVGSWLAAVGLLMLGWLAQGVA